MTRVFSHIHSRVNDFPTVTFHLGNDDLGKHLSFLVLKKLSKASIKTKLKYFKCYCEMWKLCLRAYATLSQNAEREEGFWVT